MARVMTIGKKRFFFRLPPFSPKHIMCSQGKSGHGDEDKTRKKVFRLMSLARTKVEFKNIQ